MDDVAKWSLQELSMTERIKVPFDETDHYEMLTGRQLTKEQLPKAPKRKPRIKLSTHQAVEAAIRKSKDKKTKWHEEK